MIGYSRRINSKEYKRIHVHIGLTNAKSRSQIRQLRKNTRNRLSDAGTRITTELADEAVLLHARAVRMSNKAASISSRAMKRISYIGELPPPPATGDRKSNSNNSTPLESANPMYTSSDTSSDTHSPAPVSSNTRRRTSRFARRKSQVEGEEQKRRGSMARLTPIFSANGDLSWLVAKTKKISWRFSYREMPKDSHDYKPAMYTAPIPPLWGVESTGEGMQKEAPASKWTEEKKRADRPDLYAPVPPGFDDEPTKENPRAMWKNHSASPKAASPVTVPKLNAQFEHYRMREFFARPALLPIQVSPVASSNTFPNAPKGFFDDLDLRRPGKASSPAITQKEPLPPSPINSSSPKVTSPVSPLETPALGSVRSKREMFEKGKASSAAQPKPIGGSNVKFDAKSSAGSVVGAKLETKSSAGSMMAAKLEAKSSAGSMTSGKMEAKSSAGSMTNAKYETKPSSGSVMTNLNNPTNHQGPAPMTAQSDPGKKADEMKLQPLQFNESFDRFRQREFLRLRTEHLARVNAKVTLNASFERFRQREFEQVPRDIEHNKKTDGASIVRPKNGDFAQVEDLGGSSALSQKNSKAASIRAARNLSASGSATNSRVIKRSSGFKFDDIIGSEATKNDRAVSLNNNQQSTAKRDGHSSIPNSSRGSLPKSGLWSDSDNDNNSVGFSAIPPPPASDSIWSGGSGGLGGYSSTGSDLEVSFNSQPSSPSSSRSKHIPPGLFYEPIPQDMLPPPPGHMSNGRPEKRGSFVSRAFRVISGSLGASGQSPGSRAIAPPPGHMPPPEFPFDQLELLRLDGQRAEQELNFREYTHLSTVFETRNEYLDSFSSAAAEEFDKQRKQANMATL